MKKAALLLLLCLTAATQARAADSQATHYAGSKSCRECHERFYGLWSGSMHGLAMQPYTETLAKEKLSPQKDDVVIGKQRYRAEVGGGYVLEIGADGKKKQYRIEYALGGKNVFYFLTPLDKGRLQTLPVAYDVRKKEWFDTALSGLRHFPGQQGGETPVGWQEYPYTFNTSCYGCHVSQLATNYDLKTDSYSTTWKEPGINCETCHGGAETHNAIMRKLPKGEKPADTFGFRPDPHQEVHPGPTQRRLQLLPLQGDAADRRLQDAGALLRPLRPGDPGKRRLLPGRPRPGGELHPDLLADEPLRQGGASSTVSPATPPAAATASRRRSSTTPASPAMKSGSRTLLLTATTRPTARRAAASPAICPRPTLPGCSAATTPCCRPLRQRRSSTSHPTPATSATRTRMPSGRTSWCGVGASATTRRRFSSGQP